MNEATAVSAPPAADNSDSRFKRGNIYRWPAGTSGNLKGRPKRAVSDRAAALLEMRLPRTPEGDLLRSRFNLKKSATWGDVIAHAMVRHAITDTAAASELCDRVEGRVAQPVELSTPTDVRILVSYEQGDDKKP